MPDNGDTKQPDPYEELEKAFSDSGHDPKKELLKFLRILDMKAQVAFDRTVVNEKVINSLDDCVALISSEGEDLKDKLRKDFYNKPARGNPIEASPEYQQVQGLSTRIPDMDEDEDLWEARVVFENFVDQESFDEALELLMTINPSISEYKLFKLLNND